jgi:uncharacterized membrane protein (UPF0127 family)
MSAGWPGRAGLALGAALSLTVVGCLGRTPARGGGGPPQTLPVTARWCLEGSLPPACIGLEVADDPQEQAWGLQMRPRLPALRGMWFPFAMASPLRFWMHRTPEPLDMLFLREGRVIAIATALPCMRLPCPSYGPDELADGVVELAAGEAERLGIRVGSPARIERLRPAAAPSAPARD